MSMKRRGFLKIVLAGLAAAPVAAAAETSFIETDDVRLKKWEHDGIKFAEWTLPAHVPPYFEAKDKTMSEALFSGNVLGPTRLRVPKRYIVPVFNQETDTKESMEGLVKRVIQAFKDNQGGRMPVVRDGKRVRMSDPKHFVLVRVKGRPSLLGMGAFPCELSPVSDFYAGLEKRPDAEKDLPGWEALRG
jgi:hypothetical protein